MMTDKELILRDINDEIKYKLHVLRNLNADIMVAREKKARKRRTQRLEVFKNNREEMEEILGPIEEKLQVHHINLMRINNKPGNLVACTGKQHLQAHASLRECVAELMERGVIKFNRETFRYSIN